MKVVYYRLATSSLVWQDAEILQIGACLNARFPLFSVFMTPTKPVNQSTIEKHGLSAFKIKRVLNGVSNRQGLISFLEYLDGFVSHKGEKILLVSAKPHYYFC